MNYGFSDFSSDVLSCRCLKKSLSFVEFLQHVSVSPCLNWILCCAITQACMDSKHAVFSFGEAQMGGAHIGKNAPTCYSTLLGYEAKRHDSEVLQTRYRVQNEWVCRV